MVKLVKAAMIAAMCGLMVFSAAGCDSDNSRSGEKPTKVSSSNIDYEKPTISMWDFYNNHGFIRDNGTHLANATFKQIADKAIDKAVTNEKDKKRLEKAAKTKYVIDDKNKKDVDDAIRSVEKKKTRNRAEAEAEWPYALTELIHKDPQSGKWVYSVGRDSKRDLVIYRLVPDKDGKFPIFNEKGAVLADVTKDIQADSYKINGSRQAVQSDNGTVEYLPALSTMLNSTHQGVPKTNFFKMAVWESDLGNQYGGTSVPTVVTSKNKDGTSQVWIVSPIVKDMKNHNDFVIICKPNEFAAGILNNTMPMSYDDLTIAMFFNFTEFLQDYENAFSENV